MSAKKLKPVTLFSVLFSLLTVLSGCARNTVYLHTYEVEQEAIDKIVATLKEKEFEVEVSDRVPPMLRLGSFIIYPRDSDDNKPLVKILDTISEHGYYINFFAKNRVRNHNYTKKTNIGLYLINPDADLLSAQQQLDLGFAFSLTDVIFLSNNCISLFSIEFAQDSTAVIRQTMPESKENWQLQWQQNEDSISVTTDDKTITYFLEKDYIRSGNRNDLILTLSPNYTGASDVSQPLSCIYESRIPLVD